MNIFLRKQGLTIIFLLEKNNRWIFELYFMIRNKSELRSDGYNEAYRLARSHYENFPIASLLIPKSLRKDISVIYWFARTADDFSDEGNLSSNERLTILEEFENDLTSALNGEINNELIRALVKTIKVRKLSPEHFYFLLKAFKQDAVKNRYKNFEEVLDYCKYSANPVGRIMLELINVREVSAFNLSDRICTALQLTNFIQDTVIDFSKGRIYYPVEEMQKFGVTEKMFELKENSFNLKQLVKFSVDRTQSFFDEGKNLVNYLSGRLKLEIAWTIKGGEMILHKIHKSDYDVMNYRPILSKVDYMSLLLKSFF